MIGQSLHDLFYGFTVAFQGTNLMWSFFGVLVGNMVGVLPGMGALSAAGLGVGKLWTAARAGHSGIAVARFEREGPNRVKLAAQVPDFDPAQHVEAARLPYCDRFTQLAITAANEALAQAGLPREHKLGARTSVILGTGVGGEQTRFTAFRDGRLVLTQKPRQWQGKTQHRELVWEKVAEAG